MTLSIIKMVLVQNRCQKWKERDKISKNANFEATDAEMPTYGDLKSGDFLQLVSPPLPPRSTYPLPLPLLSPPPLKRTHPSPSSSFRIQEYSAVIVNLRENRVLMSRIFIAILLLIGDPIKQSVICL